MNPWAIFIMILGALLIVVGVMNAQGNIKAAIVGSPKTSTSTNQQMGQNSSSATVSPE